MLVEHTVPVFTHCSAETQGRTDQYISTWLKEQRREDLVLATKVSKTALAQAGAAKHTHVFLPLFGLLHTFKKRQQPG